MSPCIFSPDDGTYFVCPSCLCLRLTFVPVNSLPVIPFRYRAIEKKPIIKHHTTMTYRTVFTYGNVASSQGTVVLCLQGLLRFLYSPHTLEIHFLLSVSSQF